ncbi:MAG TPA: RNA polymerase sigma factor [Acidimicrobiales bacterium]|nr:RNA polymerase sigma factor [Acidimicrobiales bacterium]
MRRTGGSRSVEAVYDALAPGVLGYFRSHRMRDPEGLTGDVFVAVTERLGRFRGDDAALRRWVFTIAHHRRVDEIRRDQRRAEAWDVLPAPPWDDAEAIDPALVAALNALTPEQREVVVLRFVADLPVAAVADIVGRSSGAVKMLQQRSVEALAASLDPPRGTASPSP